MKTAIPQVHGTDLVTAGRIQHLVTCPACGRTHRHLDLGVRRAPCGARYAVTAPQEPRP